MDFAKIPQFSVSDFIAVTNQTLEYAYQSVQIVGEVQSFKVNQGKFVFFDLKDEEFSVGCFMMLFSLRVALEDGMKVMVQATPKLTKFGKFSLTIQHIQLVGEGTIKRNFELLHGRLQKEGLFDEARKRILPSMPTRVAVISSMQSAGYKDFIKIIDERWSGLHIDVAHVQVQGAEAPNQIIKALEHINQSSIVYDVVLILRGGGSADDLSVFNDEQLVRAVAGSRFPTLTGIGHEVDTTLVDLVADRRASTPSSAAQILVPDRVAVVDIVNTKLVRVLGVMERRVDTASQKVAQDTEFMARQIIGRKQTLESQLEALRRTLRQLDPEQVLNRGYSIVRRENGLELEEVQVGDMVAIETKKNIIKSEVIDVKKR